MPMVRSINVALDVISKIAVTLAAAVLIWTLAIAPSASVDDFNRPPKVEPVVGFQLDPTAIRHMVGTGPIAIIEFLDYQCPYCSAHANEELAAIRRDLVEPGFARYVAMHFPLEHIHPFAMQASEAAECAGQQDYFWEMHGRLFESRTALDTSSIVRHAEVIGMNVARFEQCLNESRTVDTVRRDIAEGLRLGVSATPTFFVGTVRPDGGIDLVNRIRGMAPLELFLEQAERLSIAVER